jgi:hypothetical protein
MNETERDLLRALKELDEAVQFMRTATIKPNLLPIFERIDQLRGSLPKSTDSQLLHYLHKQSYEKARLWLEGRESENIAGTCRY